MSSKLRKLKQQAYEAGRKRDWSGAAEAYAQILDMDKNNPSSLNEYGDVLLKAGETTKAVRQFLAAASKYRSTGLLNNAQAVYKKVLRHDEANLNANWFLAEIRASQGLKADGEHHALTFLSAAEEVSGEIKEIFHKRCLELFDLYPDSDAILERVEGIFRIADMKLESARAGCLRACLHHAEGQTKEAADSVAKLVEQLPEICNYVEYTRWQQLTGQIETPAGFSDVNTISLADDAAPEEPAANAPEPENTPDPVEAAPEPIEAAPEPADAAPEPTTDPAAPVESPSEAASAFEEFLADGGELDTTADSSPLGLSNDAPEEPLDIDDDGCISIDVGGETSLESLIEEAAESVAKAAATVPDAAVPVEQPASGGSVNLLDEILAEEGEDILRSSDTEQVSTIASEIGRNLAQDGSSAESPDVMYQQGLVYLEMGLYDQASLAFQAAAADASHALQAREMWGIALHREGRLDDALNVLTEGLGDAGDGDRTALGLRYQAGRILEELERVDEAQEHYRRVHAVDAGFADVAQRLRAPVV